MKLVLHFTFVKARNRQSNQISRSSDRYDWHFSLSMALCNRNSYVGQDLCERSHSMELFCTGYYTASKASESRHYCRCKLSGQNLLKASVDSSRSSDNLQWSCRVADDEHGFRFIIRVVLVLIRTIPSGVLLATFAFTSRAFSSKKV